MAATRCDGVGGLKRGRISDICSGVAQAVDTDSVKKHAGARIRNRRTIAGRPSAIAQQSVLQ